MKHKFPEYYRPDSEELSKLFDECLFVFDTNALLDVFRLDEDIAGKVITLIQDFHKRIVIPYHVAEEFHSDYLDVVCGELANGKEAVRQLEHSEICQLLGKEFVAKIPKCIRKNFIKDLEAVFVKYKGIQNKRNVYLDSQKETGILLRRISVLLGDVMLEGFSKEELNNIFTEGAQRYSDSIPPGYKDKAKENNQYGDLIIWKEILKEAKKQNKSVIFISNDLKEDWIQICHGMKCGPRIELLREFQMEIPGKTFYTYSLESFLSYANKNKQSLKNKELEMIKAALKNTQESTLVVKMDDETLKEKVSEGLDFNVQGESIKENLENKSTLVEKTTDDKMNELKGEANLFGGKEQC